MGSTRTNGSTAFGRDFPFHTPLYRLLDARMPQPPIADSDPFKIRYATRVSPDGVYMLQVAAPGRTRDDFEVTIKGRIVFVNTVTKEDPDTSEKFELSYKLSSQQDDKNITVSMENGVLTLKIPNVLPSEREVRKIEIT